MTNQAESPRRSIPEQIFLEPSCGTPAQSTWEATMGERSWVRCGRVGQDVGVLCGRASEWRGDTTWWS